MKGWENMLSPTMFEGIWTWALLAIDGSRLAVGHVQLGILPSTIVVEHNTFWTVAPPSHFHFIGWFLAPVHLHLGSLLPPLMDKLKEFNFNSS